MTTDTHDFVLKTFRVLIADLVQQFNGGHPGGAMGMAAIGVALFKYVLNYSPESPDFFNRDRFVLSNGHTCLFQYAFQHLVGYKHMTMDQLKTYHSADHDSFCPGHPEIELPGVEITTGALGQGISNSVGLAIASKNLQATYNRPGFDVVSNHTFCMVGDGCLQEGVALESISLAGHLGLNNLTVIYDNNQITCDGTVDITNTENIKAKFEACNWQVLEVEDGSNDVDGIVAALEESKKSASKPTLVIVYTVIGVDTGKAGTAAAHGAAYGQEEVDKLHELYGFSVDKKYHVPKEVYDFFSDVIPRGEAAIDSWNSLVAKYAKEHPELAEEFQSRVKGQLPKDWKSLIPSTFPDTPTASRKSSGIVVDSLAAGVNSLIVGTADLDPSVNLKWKGRKIFQKPDHKPGCGVTGDYTGRFIHYGIREHAMAAISNGISAFNKGTFIPVTSTFFMFYLYAAPAVRYGALSHLQVIHVATHDSIGTGEDGPTHHPIALAALYRAMPNMLYIRPCDSNETAAAWEIAMEAKNTPSIISLSRQNLPQYPQYASKEGVAKGAYLFIEQPNAVLNLISSGSEMFLAVGTAEKLKEKGIIANVISFPCQRLFEAQPLEYKRNLLKRGKIPSVVIEAYAPTGWERYATAGINMRTFGKSLPGAEVYKYFGFDTEVITPKIEKYLEAWKEDPSLCYEFQDL